MKPELYALLAAWAACGLPPSMRDIPDGPARSYHVELDRPVRVVCDGPVNFSPSLSIGAPPACERPGQVRACTVSYWLPQKQVDHLQLHEYRNISSSGTPWKQGGRAARGFSSLRENRSYDLPDPPSSSFMAATYPGPPFKPDTFWVSYAVTCRAAGDPMIQVFNWELAYMDVYFAPDPGSSE